MPHQCTNCARRFDDGSKEMLSGCPNCGGTKFQYLPSDLDPGSGTDGAGVDDDSDDTPAHDAQPDRGFAGTPAGDERFEQPEPPGSDRSAVARRVGRATARLREVVGDGRLGTPPGGDGEPPDDAAVVDAGPTEPEDGAQSSARSEMVSADELPDAPRTIAGGVASFDEGDVAGYDDEGVANFDDTDVADPDDGDVEGFEAAATADPADRPPQGPVSDGQHGGRVVEAPSERRPDLAELREELNEQFEGIRICEPGQYELNLMELYEREETIIALQENGRYVIEPPESWRGD